MTCGRRLLRRIQAPRLCALSLGQCMMTELKSLGMIGPLVRESRMCMKHLLLLLMTRLNITMMCTLNPSQHKVGIPTLKLTATRIRLTCIVQWTNTQKLRLRHPRLVVVPLIRRSVALLWSIMKIP